jgi:hypothetical protein
VEVEKGGSLTEDNRPLLLARVALDDQDLTWREANAFWEAAGVESKNFDLDAFVEGALAVYDFALTLERKSGSDRERWLNEMVLDEHMYETAMSWGSRE